MHKIWFEELNLFCFRLVRRVMVILSTNVIAPGSEVGHRIGNPTNAEKPERDATTSDSSAATHHQNSMSSLYTFVN